MKYTHEHLTLYVYMVDWYFVEDYNDVHVREQQQQNVRTQMTTPTEREKKLDWINITWWTAVGTCVAHMYYNYKLREQT